MPGFAIAIFDGETSTLGVASGGTKIGGIRAGEATTFYLNFYPVSERICKAEYFYFSVKLTNHISKMSAFSLRNSWNFVYFAS